MKKEYKRLLSILIIQIVLIVALIAIVFSCVKYMVSHIDTCEAPRPKMSQQEKDIYNAPIKPYVNYGVKGSEVKSMIESIISMNQENVGKQYKFVGIRVEGTIENYSQKDKNALKEACEQASIYNSQTGEMNENPTGNNTESNVDNVTENLKNLKSQIDSRKNYNIKSLMYDGIYTWIIISEAE